MISSLRSGYGIFFNSVLVSFRGAKRRRNLRGRNPNRMWVSHPLVIPSMSSEETCLQGFPNDDIFGVIAFALVQIKAVGLRYKRTITVERSVVGIRRSESSACVRSTLHQAIGRAKLRQDFLPVLDLRAYARLCGEIARASKVLSNKRTLVAFAYAMFEQ